MQTINPSTLVLVLAALGGALAGALVIYLAARAWCAAAHERGRTSRDAEVASLFEQRDAALTQVRGLDSRIERYERDWSAAESNLRTTHARAAAQQAQAERLASELAEVRAARDSSQRNLVELTGRHAALEAGTKAQAAAAAEKLALLDQAEQRLRESFQNLAHSILEDKAERFREQSVLQVGGLIDPLKLQLKEFRDTVSQTHASEQRERGMLAQEIQGLKQLNQRISEDAINLTRALKGESRAQGAWGEMVLERVLEASGLQAGREYETQTSFSGAEGERQRPDVIVRLPDDKDIVIDAKVSLVAYERFCNAVDDVDRTLACNEHVASLRRHIDGLAAKNYSAIAGLRTLDFVLLFVPVEAAFIEAVRGDDRLYAHALSKNISLVSPSTLLATLRTVAHLWRIERRNVNAVEIARKAALLHDNFALMVGEIEAIGSQLEKARTAQASALRRLTDGGKGSVVLQIQSLAEMGAPVKKPLSATLIGSAGAGIDNDDDRDPVDASA